MSPQPEKAELDRLAAESGLALAIVVGREQVESSNDNSICKTLNRGGKFSGPCAKFCGAATAEIEKAGGGVSYRCHAGLECRALPTGFGSAVIVGRALVKAEDYRAATQRAVSGDWKVYSSAELFENVLLTTSTSVIDTFAKKVAKWLAAASPSTATVTGSGTAAGKKAKAPKAAPVQVTKLQSEPPTQTELAESAGRSAWRSFFGSLLSSDYVAARK